MNNIELANKVEELIPNKKQFKMKVLRNLHLDLYNEVLNKTGFLSEGSNLSLRIAFLKADLNGKKVCVICNKEHERIDSDYCCIKCYYSDSQSMKRRTSKVDQKAKVAKQKKTMLEKYGYETNSQRPEIKTILSKSKLEKSNPEALEKLLDREWLENEYSSKSSVEIAEELGVYYGTVTSYLSSHHGIEIKPHSNESSVERKIKEFLLSEFPDIVVESHDRNILSGKEIDIYIPEYKFAIEVNGLYWHSVSDTKKSNTNKHLEKTLGCLEKGISVIHITQEKWETKQELVKSMIRNHLGATPNRVFARKCEVRPITPSEYRIFCNNNHINGTAVASIKLGLFYKDELVQVMSFSKPRYNRHYEYELIRLCSAKNTSVVGGASRLFNHFLSLYTPKSILCYADRQYGEGNVYGKIGMTLKDTTPPGYRWTDGNSTFSRIEFQKHKLQAKLKNFDSNLSERENMLNNGYRMYFDCGNIVWEWTNTEKLT